MKGIQKSYKRLCSKIIDLFCHSLAITRLNQTHHYVLLKEKPENLDSWCSHSSSVELIKILGRTKHWCGLITWDTQGVCTDQSTVRAQSEPRPPHTWSHPAGCVPSTVWLFWSVLVGEFLCRSGSQLRLSSNLHIFLDPSDNRGHCNPSSCSCICPLSMCILPSKVLLYLLNFSWSHSLLSTLAMSRFQKTGISLLASWKKFTSFTPSFLLQ